MGVPPRVVKPCLRCERNRKHGHANWAVPVMLGLLMEAEGIRRQHFDHTLSQATRYVFQTDKTVGKYSFIGAWALLSWWLVPHITRGRYTK